MSSLDRVQRGFKRALVEQEHAITLQVLKDHAAELTLGSLKGLLRGPLGARLASVTLDELMRPVPRSSTNRFAQKDVDSRLQRALDRLAISDKELFRKDVNERSLTHKLAEHLTLEFLGWDVDCEYNRDGGLPKRLVRYQGDLSSMGDIDAPTVFPDIIVHKRGTMKNLLVIEVKKDSSRVDHKFDWDKLKAFKYNPDGHKYSFAAFVVLKTLARRTDRKWDVHWPESLECEPPG